MPLLPIELERFKDEDDFHSLVFPYRYGHPTHRVGQRQAYPSRNLTSMLAYTGENAEMDPVMSSSEAKQTRKFSSTRSGQTRRPLERILRIHEEVKRGRFPNCTQLSSLLEVSPRTVQRDIDFLRDEWGHPLVYDAVRHGFFYNGPVPDVPCPTVTVEDVVALFLARQALEPLNGSPLEHSLRNSFRQLAASLTGQIIFHWSDLDQVFSVQHRGVVPADITLFEALSRAVLQSREVTFEYRKIDAEAWEPRRLKPWHLAEVDGGWYLIGYDVLREALRTFALQRIRVAEVTNKRFVRPEDFNLATHLEGSFGVWSPSGNESETSTQRVRLRFHGWAARIVAERRWHPSQQIAPIANDEESIELILELSSLVEIKRWILSWGNQVEVMAPQHLRSSIKEELRDSLNHYQ